MPDPTATNPIAKISSIDFFQCPHGFLSITNRGVVVRGELTWEEWRLALLLLLWIRNQFHTAACDLIGHGRRQYGDVLVDESLGQMQFPLNDAKRAEAIGKVPVGARPDGIAPEYLYVTGAAGLPPEKAREWLQTACDEKLSALELKRSIEVGHVQRTSDTPAGKGSNAGIVTIENIRMLFVQWRRENGERILNGPIETQQRLLDEMQPLVELIDQLRHHLSKN